MKISSSTEYAARLMAVLARSQSEASVSAERLSALENIPADYVNQILLKLKRAGLVESRRGQGGGYALARAPQGVTLGQIMRAVEGRIFEGVCEKYESGERDCRHQSRCAISPVWRKLAVLVESYLDGVTLAQIMEEKPAACGAAAAGTSGGMQWTTGPH
ncbi:MAG TPA: Rrf2 family transcriptional regulator [Elusimicrobiota bacterium]|nr:Rrf2 family transcriptional regulator [Elusimicrobiota bacterium]